MALDTLIKAMMLGASLTTRDGDRNCEKDGAESGWRKGSQCWTDSSDADLKKLTATPLTRIAEMNTE